MNGLRVIKLGGELDLARREEVRQALQVGGSESGILLDFSEVTYADSTLLSEVLRFLNDARTRGILVSILVGNAQFARIIQYAGLGEAIEIFSDRSQALMHLSSGQR